MQSTVTQAGQAPPAPPTQADYHDLQSPPVCACSITNARADLTCSHQSLTGGWHTSTTPTPGFSLSLWPPGAGRCGPAHRLGQRGPRAAVRPRWLVRGCAAHPLVCPAPQRIFGTVTATVLAQGVLWSVVAAMARAELSGMPSDLADGAERSSVRLAFASSSGCPRCNCWATRGFKAARRGLMQVLPWGAYATVCNSLR